MRIQGAHGALCAADYKAWACNRQRGRLPYRAQSSAQEETRKTQTKGEAARAVPRQGRLTNRGPREGFQFSHFNEKHYADTSGHTPRTLRALELPRACFVCGTATPEPLVHVLLLLVSMPSHFMSPRQALNNSALLSPFCERVRSSIDPKTHNKSTGNQAEGGVISSGRKRCSKGRHEVQQRLVVTRHARGVSWGRKSESGSRSRDERGETWTAGSLAGGDDRGGGGRRGAEERGEVRSGSWKSRGR
nr:hypothetical protein Iba_chr07aCG14870 [Ipomoea batatas]